MNMENIAHRGKIFHSLAVHKIQHNPYPEVVPEMVRISAIFETDPQPGISATNRFPAILSKDARHHHPVPKAHFPE